MLILMFKIVIFVIVFFRLAIFLDGFSDDNLPPSSGSDEMSVDMRNELMGEIERDIYKRRGNK